MAPTRRVEFPDGASDLEETAERETLAALQRRCRREESARVTLSRSTEDEIRRQEREIAQLEQEKDSILEDLTVAKRTERSNEETATELRKLILRKVELDKKIEKERAQTRSVDASIRAVWSKIESAKKTRLPSPLEAKNKIKKKKIVVDRKSDLCLSRLGAALAESKRLRREIDEFRWNKSVYLRRREKLEQHLTALMEAKNAILDLSINTHREREEFNQRAEHIKERSGHHRRFFELEMQELTRLLAHEDSLREFMLAKTRPREEDKAVRQKMEKEAEERQKRLLSASQPTPLELESFFIDLQVKTGAVSIDAAVEAVEDREMASFARFNLVNEMAATEQRLREEVEDLNLKIGRQTSEDSATAAAREEERLRLESASTAFDEELESLRVRVAEAASLEDDLLGAVEGSCRALRCGTGAAFDSALGNRERRVNAYNVLSFLGAFDERATQTLRAKAFLEVREAATSAAAAGESTPGLSPQASAKGGGVNRQRTFEDLEQSLDRKLEVVDKEVEEEKVLPMKVKAPDLGDVEDDDDDDVDEGFEDAAMTSPKSTMTSSPLNRDALRQRALESIKRREKEDAERAAQEQELADADRLRQQGSHDKTREIASAFGLDIDDGGSFIGVGGGGGGGGGGGSLGAGGSGYAGGRSPRSSGSRLSEMRKSTMPSSYASSSYSGH